MKEERDPSSVQQVLDQDFGECVFIRHEYNHMGCFEWMDEINSEVKAFCE